jgi:V-type H+-transporting ATPase subunit a
LNQAPHIVSKTEVAGIQLARHPRGGLKVQDAVTDAHAAADEHGKAMPSVVQVLEKPWPEPPTYFDTNAFTQSFQAMVDIYGTPRYQEANPAVFTMVTFPFLFGVMYGDIGHGTCIFMMGCYLVATEKVMEEKQLGEMVGGIYQARYMLVMMGAFAVYCGWIYNDFFAMGIDAFGTRWVAPPESTCSKNQSDVAGCTFKPNGATPAEGNVYPFGTDPAWHGSTNELLFYNSMKMKMSVILGVLQMLVGTIMRGFNAIFYHETLDFFWEFLPQLIFSMSLFGYMCVMIFVKWTIDWNIRMGLATNEAGEPIPCPLEYGGDGNGCQPPSLISALIDIVLKPGIVADPMFSGQAALQTMLLGLALLSVPAMLFVKPIAMKMRHAASQGYQAAGAKEGGGHGGGHGHGGEFNFGETMIHQGIETIEFVLGMVSNTASYLRLWALSLAHSQLAQVFWTKILVPAIESQNAFAIVFAFACFAGVTTSVSFVRSKSLCVTH